MSRSARSDDAITIPVAPLRRLITIVVVLIILAAVAAFALAQRDRLALAFGGTPAAYVDQSTYQSVVLTTNQVYFGKLRVDGDVYLLTDVFSLNSSDTASGSVQLVKRGGELSGPQDPLVVPGRSVLFFENMRQDSQVMIAIRQIKSGTIPTQAPATATPVRTSTPAPSATR